ncbi:hypothetical protein R3P38DRAFT_2453289, partial [Favolaschia claudopus]
KTAKQNVTCTGFFAVLLNFPPHLRYLIENMCLLGVGPGPFGPTYGRYNPFLQLMVEEFLEFWKGVFYTRTFNYPSGRHTKAMLVPLVSDSLAARLAAGFTSVTSNFFCLGCQIDMGHIEQFFVWEPRNHETHLEHALAWKTAKTIRDQEYLATKTGVRYSALLELPYWKAVRYVLTEPMHVLDLDLISHHCRELFRIDLEVNGGDGSEHRVARPRRPSDERIKQVLDAFRTHRHSQTFLKDVLKNPWVNFETLWHICNDNDLRISGQRRDWFVLRIQDWVHITDEELTAVKIPAPPPTTLQDISMAAAQMIKTQPISRTKTEVELELCEKLSNAIYRGTKFSSLKSYNTETYEHLCAIRKLSKEGTKEALYDRLSESILIEKNLIPDLIQGSSTQSEGPVLGKDVMTAVWNDMRKTILPSWIGAAPKNWGTSTRGKLSADHWRTIFTIHLPITLIWLWRDETGRKRLLLDNMIDLHLAILAANLKTTDPHESRTYDLYIKQYLTGISKLFRENNIMPTHHAALHIGPELREFGPTHARSAQFYERYIHVLQRQNTNMKFGSIETTYMNATGRASNLKAILTDNKEVRSKVSETIKVYEHSLNRNSRGIRLANMIDPEDTHFDQESHSHWSTLTRTERHILQDYLCFTHPHTNITLSDWQASASIMDKISVNGVCYAQKNVQKFDQDSYILYNVPNTTQIGVGQIINIFQYWYTFEGQQEQKGVYLIVDSFSTNIADIIDIPDPYRKYPNAVGYLCSRRIIETRVIESKHIWSHFGMTPIEYNNSSLMHVLPLSRVS